MEAVKRSSVFCVALGCLFAGLVRHWCVLVPNWWDWVGVVVLVVVLGEHWANRGAGNTRKSGFYIEQGRDGVRMG